MLKPCTKRLISAANTPLHTVGLFTASVTYPPSGASAVITVCVVQGLRHALLSCSDSLSLGLIKPLFSNDGVPPDAKLSSDVQNDGPNSMQSATVIPPGSEPVPVAPSAADRIPEAVLADFPPVFFFKEPYSIPLTDGVKPFCLYTARNVALPIRPQVEAELQRMEDLGVIQRVLQPTDWCYRCGPHMRRPETAQRCCTSFASPAPYSRRDTRSDRRFHSLHQARCYQWILANTTQRGVPASDYLYHTSGSILLHQASIRRIVSTGNLSAADVRHPTGFGGCRLSNGQHSGTRPHSGGKTRSPLTCRSRAPGPSGCHAEPRQIPMLSPDLTFFGVHLTPDGIRPDDGKTEAIRVFRTP